MAAAGRNKRRNPGADARQGGDTADAARPAPAYTQPQLIRVAGELEEVPAHQRVAAGQYEDRPVAETSELVDQVHCLTGIELPRIPARLCVGTAVLAGVGACARDLPGDREGRAVEVGADHAGVALPARAGGCLTRDHRRLSHNCQPNRRV